MKKKENLLLVATCIIVILATLVGYEIYLNSSSKKKNIRSHKSTIAGKRDATLGYRPIANNEYIHTKSYKDEIIYQVTIKTDEYGLRISPPYNSDSLNGYCLFFGGSRTFGEGVQNEEALPYQVGLTSEGKYRTFNFGYSGYGPHQMLAALESGMVEKIIPNDNRPKYVFYQVIKNHIQRVTGRASWDPYGPRYILDATGKARHIGNFSDIKTISDQLNFFLRKSTIYRQIFEGDDDIGAEELELYAAVVEASKENCERLFPDSEFYVLFWNGSHSLNDKMIAALKAREVNVLLMYDMLPEKRARAYRLHKYDSHPKPLAYELIAKYLVKNVLKD